EVLTLFERDKQRYNAVARVKSVSVLDEKKFDVQTETDCIGIENKQSNTSIRGSLVDVGREEEEEEEEEENRLRQQAEIKVYPVGYA
ncbi:unnamed protein product, partial [Rotaria socialis]